MNDVRKVLEAIRFAPGRADLTDIITEPRASYRSGTLPARASASQ